MHKALVFLAVIIMIGVLSACSESASTPLPPVRIIRPIVTVTRMPEEIHNTTDLPAAPASSTATHTADATVIMTLSLPASPARNATQMTDPTVATPLVTATVRRASATETTNRRATVTPLSATGADWYPCEQGQIKGNRNSSIYHLPSGVSYAKTRLNVQCFDTEAQAQAAGFRRSKK